LAEIDRLFRPFKYQYQPFKFSVPVMPTGRMKAPVRWGDKRRAGGAPGSIPHSCCAALPEKLTRANPIVNILFHETDGFPVGNALMNRKNSQNDSMINLTG